MLKFHRKYKRLGKGKWPFLGFRDPWVAGGYFLNFYLLLFIWVSLPLPSAQEKNIGGAIAGCYSPKERISLLRD